MDNQNKCKKTGKLVAIEIRVRAMVPSEEAAKSVQALFSAAAMAVARAATAHNWGGGSFRSSLVYENVAVADDVSTPDGVAIVSQMN
jgi:hypothetical protein